MVKKFSNQGLTYCRPEKKQQPLLGKTSLVYCPICHRRRRGVNHDQGKSHLAAVAALKKSSS